ncbi:hypothetical protein [Pontibacter chitinilyticus]|uniref:hypothetical protein n=1 Tax=Pontibacter chitinilyticus TaxID=2674989 RepID=UPI003219129F
MKKLTLTSLLFLFALVLPLALRAQSKTKASVAFSFFSDASEDHYNQRITHKTIPLSQDAFVILSRQSEGKYTVAKYNKELDKAWETAIDLVPTETVDAFVANQDAAVVVTRRDNGQGSQLLYGYRISLSNGQLQERVLLLEAPAKSRRASIASSEDGSRLLAYRYHTDASFHIRDIDGILYDGNLQKLQETKYNLTDEPGILSADVQVSNSGEQYICLISDNMNRLTVRRYSPKSPEAKVMTVLVGGVFDGQKVYILDSRFKLMPNGTLYGAVLTADEKSGKYYSLKAVRFDFEAKDMVFAEQFKFTPEYLAKVNALDKSGSTKPNRLEDIYLSDLFLTPEKKLVVLAEKKYMEGGDTSPYFARELHLFAYDEFMNRSWNSVLMKYQKAPNNEGFSGISYSAYLNGNTLNLLTLENLNGKYDLFLRQLNTSNGEATTAKAIGLNVANDKELAYVKDFTAWLADKDIVTVVRPSKKANGLRLSHIIIK